MAKENTCVISSLLVFFLLICFKKKSKSKCELLLDLFIFILFSVLVSLWFDFWATKPLDD